MTQPFDTAAHWGVPTDFHENTLQSFERAIELGSDAVELDVRLTAASVPVVYHYAYLQEKTSLAGPIFKYTLAEIRRAHVLSQAGASGEAYRIPSLAEALDALAGRIGLEIEIKGPEPESPQRVAEVDHSFKSVWPTIEVTSLQPHLLRGFRELCPRSPLICSSSARRRGWGRTS